MKIGTIIDHIQEGGNIIVLGKTFEVTSLEEVRNETGDSLFWIRDGGDLWLSIDAGNEEFILFNQIEAEIDSADDTVVYSGEDYEFTYEDEGTLYEEDEEIDRVSFRDYESSGGDILRVIEYSVNNEINCSIGQKLAEEDIQNA